MKRTLLVGVFLAGIIFGFTSESQAQVNPDQIYGMLCALCHGADGKPTKQGAQFGSPDFTDPNWQKSKTDDQLIQSMTKGTDNPNYKSVTDMIQEMLGVKVDVSVFLPKVRSFETK
ncbi:MAG TPA: c-type cytochrome [Candidatus Hypogeohydataceae bacterium YC41]